MALITQKTNLKSLRYGKDRPGGGSSNQPYIVSSLPGDPSSFNTLSKELKFLDKVVGAGKNIIDFAGTDFFLRGGSAAVSRAAKDVSRLTQMFADFKSPNGVLFAAKQNVLSLTGVKTQASGFMNEGIYLPTSTVLQAAGNAFGVHLNKQGLNPFRKTTPSEGFIGGLFEFTGPLGLPTYAQTIKPDQNPIDNRLVQLANWKLKINTNPVLLGPAPGDINELAQANLTAPLLGSTPTIFQNPTPSRTTYVQIRRSSLISSQDGEILQYAGGPQSLLGVGKTTIKRPIDNYTDAGLDFRKNPNFEGRYYVLNSTQISNIPISKESTNVIDFRTDLIDQQTNSKGKKNILSKSPDYSINGGKNRIENRFNLGDPGRRDKDITSYVSGARNKTDGSKLGPLDKIISYPLYESAIPDTKTELNDFVKFRIGIYDNKIPTNKVYIHFRAFLDSMDDNYTAEWNSFKYVGRGENFYRYGGFTRTINLGWTVAAQSKEELMPMYQKLNFLASSLTPDYSTNGYMRGNLATLTVGGYLFEQPGIITSINYSVPQESPWEIAIGNGDQDLDPSVKELSHIIKVTGFQFIPIHTFVPRKQQNTYNQYGLDEFGKERYIALRGPIQAENGYDYINAPSGVIEVSDTEIGESFLNAADQ
jgi:hypothetical protein